MYQLFSHNDLDGVGCGIVAKLAFGNRINVRYLPVGALDYQVTNFLEEEAASGSKDNILFITDLSVNEENEKKIDEFVRQGGEVTLIDHHKTAGHLNQYEWGRVTVQYEDGRLTCATSLLYDFLVQKKKLERSHALDEFVELVRQYDTWEWDVNNNVKAKQLNDLLFMTTLDEFEERMIDRLLTNTQFEFSEFEEKLLAVEEDKIERYIRRKNREIVQLYIHPYLAGIVHAESYHSELGNALGKEHEHLDYIVILNLGSRKISFRTVHDHVDVSTIASELGGGGHAKASGCRLTEKTFETYVRAAFAQEPIRPDASRNQYNLKGTPRGCLYENKNEDQFLIYEKTKMQWVVEKNGHPLEGVFQSFEEAERQLKRKYSAWLLKDDRYIDFLQKRLFQTKKE